MTKEKAFIVYDQRPWYPDYVAYLILGNGMIPATHVCSAPGYMRGDLYERRAKIKEQFPEIDISEPMSMGQFFDRHRDVFNLAFEVDESLKSETKG